MILRNGLALSVPVSFPSGNPDGNLAWRLFDGSGTLLTSGVVPVAEDAVSIAIQIAPTYNTLGVGALTAVRDLEWDFAVGGVIVNGEQRYNIESRPAFGVSSDGVRAKLGVEISDLPDEDISLIRAYLTFRTAVGADLLMAVTDEAKQLAIRDAIEAQAALALIPTMAVRVAVSEDSGTNAYKRQAIDWGAVAESLSSLVTEGILVVDPAYDPTPVGALFILATPALDPFTGGSYT